MPSVSVVEVKDVGSGVSILGPLATLDLSDTADTMGPFSEPTLVRLSAVYAFHVRVSRDAGDATTDDMLITSHLPVTISVGAGDYISVIQAADSGGGGGDVVEGWVRPDAWPALPATAAEQLVMVARVTDSGTNFAAFSLVVSSGTYTVDWGDGTVDEVASSANAEHNYDFADEALGAADEYGDKYAVITATPTTGGQTISAISMAQSHSQSGLSAAYGNPWVEARINAPNCVSLVTSFSPASRCLEHVNIEAIGTLSSVAYMFFGASNLRKVQFPANMAASCAAGFSMFHGCGAIEKVEFPTGFGAALTSVANMFNGARALKEVVFNDEFGATVTAMNYMFADCTALKRVVFPDALNVDVSEVEGLFDQCAALKHVKFPVGFGTASLTTHGGCFNGCYSLVRIQNFGANQNLSLVTASLSAAALDELFGDLQTVSGKTITVTGNWGTAGMDDSIATAKGWTVA